MPKVAVDEDRDLAAPDDEVGLSWDVASMKPEAAAAGVNGAAQQKFGLSVL